MGYIRKEFRIILDKSDRQFVIPNCFERFIHEKKAFHNLIIKSKGGNCICTNCHHHFLSKAKINKEIKCPNCKQKLLIKTDRLSRYVFKDYLQLLDKVDDTFILRTFELYSFYNDRKTEHFTTEFMRTIIKGDLPIDFVTNQVHNHMGYMYIAHYQPFHSWRKRNRRWAYRDVTGMVCPYNLKSILKNTDLKYSQLDKFVSKMEYIDFIEYFTTIAHYPSFEMLVKLKLYHLAKDANQFYLGNTFQSIFELPKTFYPFMKKHNINYEQLKVLQLLKRQDIKLIKRLVGYYNLEELSRYVDLKKAYQKILRKHSHSEHEYLDYLRACKQLGYDMKCNKILFPSNLRMEHDRVYDLLEIVKNEANDRLIEERVKELNKYVYQNNKYIVFPASSVDSLIEESRQQKNCVKSYCSRYALAETDIYFMRELEHQDKSLVTIEVKKHKVVQSKIKGNNPVTKEQQKFIDRWEKKILVAS